ncbi:MAG: 3-isopropylmalate dehydratase small subunit [Acidobacteria bacterium]|nr:3-isopropylmalate dehydratase small subunit [Acidobacteriota bacterium]
MSRDTVTMATSSPDRRIDLVSGTAIPLRGNNIDTDRIIPARYLKAITFEGLGEHVFEDDRASMPDHPFENPAYAGASILVVNENFGSGSSREHAPQALKRWGIGACVGESFSEIFLGNATAIGLPCATADAGGVERLMSAAERDPQTRMTLSVAGSHVEAAGHTVPVRIPDAVREALLTGQWDATALLLDDFDAVRAVSGRLPYVTGF